MGRWLAALPISATVVRASSCALVLLSLLVGGTAPARAATSEAQAVASTTITPPPPSMGGSQLSVSPAIVENKVDPGASFDVAITLTNGTAEPVGIRANVRDYEPPEGVSSDRSALYETTSWYRLDVAEFLLKAGEARTVKVSVSVPKDADPGGHYAVVYFEAFLPTATAPAAAATVNAQVGVVSLLTVRGDIREHVEMSGPIEVPSVQTELGSTMVRFRLRNDGTIHIRPAGAVVIRDVFGNTVERIPLESGTLLPGVTHDYEVEWSHPPLVGRYHAEVEVSYGAAPTTIRATSKSVYLVPVPIIAGVMVLFASMALLLIVGRVRRRRRRARNAALVAALASIGPEVDDRPDEPGELAKPNEPDEPAER